MDGIGLSGNNEKKTDAESYEFKENMKILESISFIQLHVPQDPMVYVSLSII